MRPGTIRSGSGEWTDPSWAGSVVPDTGHRTSLIERDVLSRMSGSGTPIDRTPDKPDMSRMSGVSRVSDLLAGNHREGSTALAFTTPLKSKKSHHGLLSQNRVLGADATRKARANFPQGDEPAPKPRPYARPPQARGRLVPTQARPASETGTGIRRLLSRRGVASACTNSASSAPRTRRLAVCWETLFNKAYAGVGYCPLREVVTSKSEAPIAGG
jgi:hypothetical protein